jgi:hypothetical protein
MDKSLLAFAKIKFETHETDLADLKFYIQNFQTEMSLILTECYRQAKRLRHFNNCVG